MQANQNRVGRKFRRLWKFCNESSITEGTKETVLDLWDPSLGRTSASVITTNEDGVEAFNF